MWTTNHLKWLTKQSNEEERDIFTVIILNVEMSLISQAVGQVYD